MPEVKDLDALSVSYTPIRAEDAIRQGDMEGERSLWVAVLQLALEDLEKTKPKRIEALKWLISPDYDTVCAYAGMDGEFIQRKLLEKYGPELEALNVTTAALTDEVEPEFSGETDEHS